MKKYILLLVFMALTTLSIKAQFSASYRVGYGKYEMGDLKDLLKNMESSMQIQFPNIPFAIVDNFPGHIAHTIDLSYRFGRHEAGIQGTYNTTGGKLAYSDYTGEYWGKLIVNGYRLGLSYRFYQPLTDFENLGSLSFFAEFSPAITLSNFKSEEYMRVFDEDQKSDDDLDLDAKGISLLPQIGLKWNITRNIGISVSGGYDFQLGSHFEYQGQKSNIKSNWSGIRINGGISFTFNN